MIYKNFKDIDLSTLGMGNMRLPTINDIPHGEIDYERAQEIIGYAMSHGINYYDTAYTYPGSEKFLGQAMKKYPRDSFYLATKYWIDANPDYAAVFEEQLTTLQTDHIDFYLLHSIMEGFGTVEQAQLALQVANKFRSSISVACTGCAYCVTECPKKLQIPKFMELYNHLKYVGYLTPPEIDEMPEDTKPHNCIGCAKCTHHCPQGLPIPAVMKELKGWEGKNSAWW